MSTTSTLFLTDIIDNQSKESKSAAAITKEGDWKWVMLGNYTSASPLLINKRNTSKITYQPSDISFTAGSGLEVNYDFVNQKFLPTTLNDLFMVEVRMKVKSSVQNDHLDLKMEAPTFAFNPLNAQTHNFVHSAYDEQFMSSHFLVYIGQDVIDNGIEFKVTAHDGNMSIYDVSYLIVRLSSGK